VLADRFLDAGCGCQGPGRLQVRQGSAAEGSLRAANGQGAAAVPGAKPTGDKITIAADALFDFDKADAASGRQAKLDEVAAKSKEIKLEVIIAVGHTDRIGSVAYNHEALRAARRRGQELPGEQGSRCQPRLHGRQG
jgi:OOP family OmpA-OmpF porin